MGQVGRRRFLTVLGATTLSWPLTCVAQHDARVRRIGVLALDRADAGWVRTRRSWILEDLSSAGFDVGKNLVIEWRFAEGDKRRLPELAEDLVRSNVDVIVAWNPVPVHAAWKATREIPIVMYSYTLDPIKEGLAKGLSRPGGNVTGTLWSPDWSGLIIKQYQILKMALPNARRIAALRRVLNPTHRQWHAELVVRVEKEIGLAVTDFLVDAEEDIPQALGRIADFKPDAIAIAMVPVIRLRIDEIVAFTKQHKLVSMGIGTPWPEVGGLMIYGTDIREIMNRTMSFVARILYGAKPGDLPIEQATRFELSFNMRTAQEIGYHPTKELLARIDRLIE